MLIAMSSLFGKILSLYLIHFSLGRIQESIISTEDNWVFITRFCFLGSADSTKGHIGRLAWMIKFPSEYHYYNKSTVTPHKLLLYPDYVWDEFYTKDTKNSLTCDEKVKLLEGTGNTHTLSPDNRFSGCTAEESTDGTTEYSCSAGKTFGTPTEKWWYIVIANCLSPKGVEIEYEMKLTNAPEGQIFFEHYSADEFFILQTDIGFLIVYFVLIGLSAYVTWSLVKIQMYHATYRLYLASLCIQLVSLIVLVPYWSDYGITGRPKDSWKYFGRFMEFASTILFVVLLILMAKGYTITRGRIRKIGVVKIIVLGFIYCLVTVSMFIWEATTFDPAEVLYIYDSIPGYILIAIRILAWLWFCYATFFTVKNYPEKRRFYIPFFIIYCLWFWAGPIMVFVALDGIPKWTREKVVNGVNLVVVFLGHLVFMIMTWPSQANENFPYHVKTTQITDASLGDPDRGQAYDPNAEPVSNGRPNTQSIFTTDTNGTSKPVNIDRFPHETGDYVQERAIAMNSLGS